ncbi:MAG: hypothetical protein J3K34DRAFT_432473 [Monoraphidium minutum]|nr:MAG: hypothetical protein J3K34DRAFT_432473 [Monoraphidium minutum]
MSELAGMYIGDVHDQALAPAMAAARRGVVINVGSVAGYGGVPLWGPYCASKAGLMALSQALRLELRPFGVSVVHATPGFVATRLHEKSAEADRLVLDPSGPYGPLAGDVAESFFSGGAQPLGEFSRRFADMALSPRPPAYYLDGHLAWPVYVLSLLPTWLSDTLVYYRTRLNTLRPGRGAAAAAVPEERRPLASAE